MNSEEFIRLNNIIMRFMPVEKMFHQFCEQFKDRIEREKKALAVPSEEES